MSVAKPKHDTRQKGPRGFTGSPRGVLIHTTEGADIDESNRDRHGVIDFLADSRGLSVPVVVDDDYSTEMIEQPGCGKHGACLDFIWGVEQCTTARNTKEQWETQHRSMVKRAAEWSAWVLATQMDLAVTKRNLRKLVVGHDRDDVFGGCSTHWDPGPNYPWRLFRQFAVAHAKIKGYRVVATKGERKRVREYRVKLPQRAAAWIRKRAKTGWGVWIKRQTFRADFDGFD